MAVNTNNDVIIGVRVELLKAQQDVKKFSKHLSELSRKGSRSFENLAGAQQTVANVQNKLAGAMGKGRREFQGWAMSIMFFGMALQRVFGSIWKESTKTFQDVMHSVEGTITQFDVLNGSLAYLWFVSGQALEPLVAFIIPIIDAISDWISHNEGLFRSLFVIGVTLGSIFAVGGAAALAVNGFIELFAKLGVVALDAQGAISGINMGAFGAFLTNPIIISVVAALALLAGLTWVSFLKVPGAFESLKKSSAKLWESVKYLGAAFVDLVNSLLGTRLTWEDLAWFMSWSLQLTVLLVKELIGWITVLVRSFNLVIEMAKAFGEAIRAAFNALKNGGNFNWSGVHAAMANVTKAWDNLSKSTKTAIADGVAFQDLWNKGPSGLRAEYEASLKVANEPVASMERYMSPVAPFSAETGTRVVYNQITNTFQVDRSWSEEQLYSALSSAQARGG